MATINPYLIFNGNCEEAFLFYQSVFGGEFPYVGRFGEMPKYTAVCESISEVDKNKIMHISLPIGKDSILIGIDSNTLSGALAFGANVSISINIESKLEAEKLFDGLSSGGNPFMPMNQAVFDYVKIIKNQENYSIWVMQDSNVKNIYQDVDGTVGFKAIWESKDNKIGAGSQQITAISEDEIAVDLHFERSMKVDNKSSTIFESISENETKVSTKFYGHFPYSMNLMTFIGEKIIKDAQTQNLANLKKILEI